MRGSLLGDERPAVALGEVDVAVVGPLGMDALSGLAAAVEVEQGRDPDGHDRKRDGHDAGPPHKRERHEHDGGCECGDDDREPPQPSGIPAYGRGKRDVSTTSKALPGTPCSEWRS